MTWREARRFETRSTDPFTGEEIGIMLTPYMKYRKPLLLLLLLTTSMGFTKAVPADVIGSLAGSDVVTQTASFGAAGTIQVWDNIAFHAFDPTLGTLDEVNIFLQGNLSVNGAEPGPGNIASSYPLTYASHPFQIDTLFQAFGLLGRGFEFDSPAQFSMYGVSPGMPGYSFGYSIPFSMNIRFNAATDLMGFTLPDISGGYVPPTSIVGVRDDFLPIFPSGDPLIEIDMLFTTTSQSFPYGAFIPDTTVGGFATIDYYYTPSSAVPEPSTLVLLGIGLAGLGVKRKKLFIRFNPNEY